MAQQKPETFAETLARVAGGAKPPATQQPAPKKLDFGGSKITKPQSAMPPDPLSWLLDIASRPLRLVTETVDTNLDTGKRLAKASLTGGDVLGEAVRGAGDAISAPFRGFFSTNPEDQPYTSDLIEKGTDVIGGIADPKRYKDTPDNVNPILKGVLGFAGDVALDPLTYVPGAALASVAKGAVKAIKTGVQGAKEAVDAVKGVRAAEKAPELANAVNEIDPVEAAAMQERATLPYPEIPKGGVRNTAKDLVAPGLPEMPAAPKPIVLDFHDAAGAAKQMTFGTVQEASEWAARTGLKARKLTKDGQPYKSQKAANTFRVTDTAAKAAALPEKASVQIATDPRAMQARELLTGLSKPDAAETTFKESVAAAKTGSKGVMLTKGDFLKSYAPELSGATWKAPGGIDVSIETIVRNPVKWLKEVPAARAVIEKAYKAYRDGFVASKAPVDIYGDPITGVKAVEPLQRPAVGAQGRFQRAIEDEVSRDRVQKVLGSHLFEVLRRTHTPQSFDKKVAETLSVFNRSEILDDIVDKSEVSTVLRSVLGMTDVDVVGTNVTRMNANSNVALVLGAQQSVEKIVEQSTEAAQGALEAVTKAMSDKAIERVNPEMTAATKAERLKNDDEQVQRVLTYLPQVIKDHFFNPSMKFTTKGGTARDSKWFGEGFGIEQRIFNGYAQWNTAQRTMDHWLTAVQTAGRGGKPLYGAARTRFVKNGTIADLKLIEQTMQREGYQLWYGVKNDAVPLTFTQMFDVLDEVAPGLVDKYFFNGGTLASYTKVMDAVLHSLRGGSKDEIMAILGSVELRSARKGQINVNKLSGDGFRVVQHHGNPNRLPPNALLAQLQRRAAPGAVFVKNMKGNEFKGFHEGFTTDVLRNELADIIMDSTTHLGGVVAKNAEALRARIKTESVELSNAALTRLDELASDPTQLGDALRAVARREDDITKMASDGGATFDAEKMATDVVNDNLEPAIVSNSEGLDKAATASRRVPQTDAATQAARKPVLQDTFNTTMTLDNTDEVALANIERASRAGAPNAKTQDEIVDAFEDATQTVGNGSSRILNAFGRSFKANLGMERVYQVLHSLGNGSASRMKRANAELRSLAQHHSGFVVGTQTKIMDAGWDAYRSGITGATPEIAAAASDIENWMSKIVGGAKGQLDYVFQHTPVSLSGLNQRMLDIGLADDMFFDEALARKAAEANGTDMLTEAFGQFKTWDVKDPLDFMSRFYAASEQLATDTAVVQGITRWLGSAAPREGYAKMSFSKDSRYGDLFNADTYWDPAVIKEIGIMDEVSRQSRMIKGGFGDFVHGYFDPVQQAWKSAITVWRPGHHIRNMIGDMSMTWVAEGHRFFRKSSQDAWSVLASRGKYTDLDITRAMNSYGMKVLPSNGTVLMKGKNGYHDLTVEQVTDAMFQNGLFNSYSSLEDLVEAAADGASFTKAVNKVALRGTKAEKVVGSISEGRDHLARAQHFLQYVYKAIEDGRFKGDYSELFRNAAFQVKKHHPDGSMLSTFEAKYMRRIIPFYSWMRGALPAIVEGAVLHPGRTTMFPKASYNLAVGMGVDPDSMYDPFPEDQLFPSFLTEQVLGPQFQTEGGEYLGVNPGIASVDIANMFGADPVRGIAGSVSPLIRMGPELLSGATWGTGAKIKDTSDYLDSSIPGINYLANITGFSPTGSILGTVTGGGLDPQAQVAAGNKSDLDKQLSVLNWITGFGVQNMSRPNYINYAEIEKRNREGE